jgi:hypothetical protein
MKVEFRRKSWLGQVVVEFLFEGTEQEWRYMRAKVPDADPAVTGILQYLRDELAE